MIHNQHTRLWRREIECKKWRKKTESVVRSILAIPDTHRTRRRTNKCWAHLTWLAFRDRLIDYVIIFFNCYTFVAVSHSRRAAVFSYFFTNNRNRATQTHTHTIGNICHDHSPITNIGLSVRTRNGPPVNWVVNVCESKREWVPHIRLCATFKPKRSSHPQRIASKLLARLFNETFGPTEKKPTNTY